VPKDKNGIPVNDMYQHMVDINSEKEGIQEVKEWIAVIEYIKSFEKNAQGIHVIPDRYKTNMESLVDLAK
jgi:hypothetical protein